jgi:hypothetical protein
MAKDTNDKKTEAVIEELRSSILKKTEAIKERILLSRGAQQPDYLQILLMIDDELDDVLLNWESESLSAISFDDDDDDY